MSGSMNDDDDYVFYHEHPEYDVFHLYTDGPDSEEEKDPLEEDLDLYANMDIDEFELLSDDEKLEKLKDAGLDPSDYEEYFDDFDEACENAELEEFADNLGVSKEKIKILLDNDIDPEDFDRMDDEEKYQALLDRDLDPEDFKEAFLDFETEVTERTVDEYADKWCIDEYDVRELMDADVDLGEFDEANDDEKMKMILDAELDPDDYEDCFDDEDYLRDLKEALGGMDPYTLNEAGIDLEEFKDMEDLERVEKMIATGLDPSDLDDYFDIEIDGVSVDDLLEHKIDLNEFQSASSKEQLQMLLAAGLDPEDYYNFPGLEYYQPED